jgi:Tol biopolymer transport system component
MQHGRMWAIVGCVVAILTSASAGADAQYFGQNKVQYRTFDFQILKTDHFDLYYYPQEAEAAGLASRMAERWYSRLSRFFDHQLRSRQALILYAAPAHFRQTNAIEGLIGEGTGGVTEALKRRIVLPMSGSLADTDHVIGHELVHAFQFDITGADPREARTSAPGILQYPLWFVEGMAEYLSLGPVDAQTAMWMRDAALHEKLPTIRDLENPKYFPYRWGHAFWAFIGAKYGDRAVASLVRSAANPRFDLTGLARQLGTDPDTLTADWHRAIRAAAAAIGATQPSLASEPRRAIAKDTGGGRFNIGPEVSPDGGHIAFFSERDRFSIELFLADAETGHIERKLLHSATDPHFDSLEFLDSAGAWSPDGHTLAMMAVRGGRPVLALLNPTNGQIEREVALPGLDDAIDPAFAPNGRSVVISGNRGGLIDLYLVSLDSGQLDRLTHDPYADLEATFTPDGTSLVFVTERFSTDLATLAPGPLRLARLDLATRAVTPISGFLHGKHLSPQVSADGRTLTFIAEPDGVSNLYRMPIAGGPIMQVSSFPTGVAGITASSPALSASTRTGRLAFSVFEDDGHVIYVMDEAKIVSLVAPQATAAAALLPGRETAGGDVEQLITDYQRGLPPEGQTPKATPYRQALSLDAIGQPTVSAGASSFGGYVSGSVSAFFSDMLGDRILGLGAQVSGRLADLGGQLVYLNRKHRWNWATSVEQTPYRLDYLTVAQDPQSKQISVGDIVQRQTSRGVFGLTAYPLSGATRLELSGGGEALTFTQDTTVGVFASDTGAFLSQQTVHTTLARPLYLAEGSAALVHDTSYFGATSPIFGERYRIEVDQTTGSLQYTGLLLDWRKYFMPKRPITIAVRGVHYGRYGQDAENTRLVPLYAGYAELVHGYGLGSFTPAECQGTTNGPCTVFNNLIGSRLLVANVEVRAPLVGLFRGDIQYGRIPIEVAAFMDTAVTWTKATLPAFLGGTRDLVRSYGGAMRVNVFGFVIVELSAAHPLDRPATRWQWQIGIRQGF